MSIHAVYPLIIIVYDPSSLTVPQKLYKPPVDASLMKSDCPSYFPIHFRLPDDSRLSPQYTQRILGANDYAFPCDSCMNTWLHISVRSLISLQNFATSICNLQSGPGTHLARYLLQYPSLLRVVSFGEASFCPSPPSTYQ